MHLPVNLRHLENRTLTLSGQLTAEELDLAWQDELVHVRQPLSYQLEVQKLDHNLLIQGRLSLTLDCECARCLKPHLQQVELAGWVCHAALEGPESVPVTNDCVDLTPLIREDILLAFPQHPLCEPECAGLHWTERSAEPKPDGASASQAPSDTWAELNKLKFDK